MFISRSSLPQVFFKIDALKNLANFKGKHVLEYLFNKVADPFYEICEIFKNTFFYITPPMAASTFLWVQLTLSTIVFAFIQRLK